MFGAITRSKSPGQARQVESVASKRYYCAVCDVACVLGRSQGHSRPPSICGPEDAEGAVYTSNVSPARKETTKAVGEDGILISDTGKSISANSSGNDNNPKGIWRRPRHVGILAIGNKVRFDQMKDKQNGRELMDSRYREQRKKSANGNGHMSTTLRPYSILGGLTHVEFIQIYLLECFIAASLIYPGL